MSSANTFGQRFSFTTFGESHGIALGVVIDGCPAGVKYDESLLLANLARRRPGQSVTSTSRNESDQPEILSGIFEGKTLGTPICVIVRNQNQRSADYDKIKNEPRKGHADDVWKEKFLHSDHRGGGRASGRETLSRVIAGSFAQMYFSQKVSTTEVIAYTSQVGEFQLTKNEHLGVSRQKIESSPLRFPSGKASDAEKFVLQLKEKNNSVGGSAVILIKNPPKSLGQPVAHKLKSDFAAACLSIGATTGFEFGFAYQAEKNNSLNLKSHQMEGASFHSEEKNYSGVRGGLSTGGDIVFTVHFKPTSSIGTVAQQGRHDPFIVPRAVPVLEAMIWSVLIDHELWKRSDCL